ncbi:MAG TPA: hypothetical protein VGC41_28475, partial [Kofleriaceae bacterium]
AAGASIRVQVGSDPMPAACQVNETVTCAVQGCAGCGRHLSPVGGAFQLPDSHFDDAALGTIEAGAFTTANPGFFNVQIPIGNTTAVEIPLLFGHASFMSGSPDAIAALRVGGMILDSNVETVFIPALAAQFQTLVVRDCTDATHPPDCGCLLNSAGKNVIGLFDKTPADCKVTIDEVKNNGLLQTLFTPDVTIGDVSGVSYGVQMTVEHASF